jgi:NitT/TauT family transport system substrate-binding protein
MMNWFAQSAHGGLFAALKNGDYERANLKMTNEQGGPQTPVVPQIGSGKVQFGMMQADQIFLGRDEGIPLVGIFTVFQINPQGLLYHMENPVKSFEELNGRKVYVAPTAAYWQYFVKKYKLDKVQQFNYNGQLAIYLNDKEVVFQCYVTTEPLTAKRQGANPGYLLNADSGFNPYANIMATTEQMIKDKPDVVQAYVSASLLGWRNYLQNPEPTLAFIKEYAKDYDTALGAETAKLEREYVLGKSMDQKMLGTISDERMKTLYDQLRDVGMLTKEQDYKQAFNSSFIEAAQKA